MKLATREQARELDLKSQSQISADALMENAGRLSAEWILKNLSEELGQVLVVCGRGNNGGDGLVVARYLKERGVKTEVIIFSGERSELFQLNLSRLKDVNVTEVSEGGGWELPKSTLLVDAYFGIGVSRALSHEAVATVRKINSHRGPIVSLDNPSGLDVNTGWDFGSCVCASCTLTFGVAKPGLYMNRGYECSGQVVVLDIGFSPEIVGKTCSTHELFGRFEAKSILPERSALANKSNFGRLVIAAGSQGMWGASVLACHSASRVGAGYVYLLSHDDPSNVVNEAPEVLAQPVNQFKDYSKATAFVVGPGLGVQERTLIFIKRLLNEKAESVILDADALTVLSETQMMLPRTWLLTPHSGEMSRLLGISSDVVEHDRFTAVHAAHKKYGASILLKGLRSIFYDGEKYFLIDSGGVALAKAGSGDVLAGMIGGYVAQGLSMKSAALLGAYLHGYTADYWVREYGHPASLLSSEIEKYIPEALRDLERATTGALS